MKVALLTTDNREHDRSYQVARPYFGTAPEALLQGFAGLANVEVHVLACTQQPMAAPEKLADNIWFHGLNVPKVGWLRTGYQGCIRATRRKLKEIKPDIVHGQGTERDCAISAVLSGFPNVVTIHGNMNAIAQLHHARFGSFHWLAAKLENFTLPRTAGIICISEYVENLVTRHGVKTWIVPNAIRLGFFDHPRAAVSPPERPVFINVGVISERKRQEELLAVLESLRAQGLPFDTIFVGSADASSAYVQKFNARLAAAQCQHGGFEHIPKLDETNLCGLMDRAAAMIHFASEETFGLTFAEAIARGLYLFASDVGAIRKIVRGVDRARVIPLDDWNGLRSALEKWMTDGEYQRPHPPTPPADFLRSFHPVSVARRHVEIYREVLKIVS